MQEDTSELRIKKNISKKQSTNSKTSSKKEVLSSDLSVDQLTIDEKAKPLDTLQRLALTMEWLYDTFPHLFTKTHCLALDDSILSYLKEDYVENHKKCNYPAHLKIEYALNRYKQSVEYLKCIKVGKPVHNLAGDITGFVTKVEETAAEHLLKRILKHLSDT